MKKSTIYIIILFILIFLFAGLLCSCSTQRLIQPEFNQGQIIRIDTLKNNKLEIWTENYMGIRIPHYAYVSDSIQYKIGNILY